MKLAKRSHIITPNYNLIWLNIVAFTLLFIIFTYILAVFKVYSASIANHIVVSLIIQGFYIGFLASHNTELVLLKTSKQLLYLITSTVFSDIFAIIIIGLL